MLDIRVRAARFPKRRAEGWLLRVVCVETGHSLAQDTAKPTRMHARETERES